MYRAKDFEDAVEKARNWLLWAVSVIPLACTLTRIPTGSRFLLRSENENGSYPDYTPASQGGIGDLYNFKLAPS